ncbi:MAG: DNA-binding response regulator [Rhodospirillales bacterium]|nr:MAG: DNA-binding response regulator [Rhodospirillales bacterium]
MRNSLCRMIEAAGIPAEGFDSAEAFLATYDPQRPGCLLLDLQMPGMSGLQLLERLATRGDARPVIVLTGHADVPTAVRAMKAGAADFIQKPFQIPELLERIRQSLALDAQWRRWKLEAAHILDRMNTLSPREREVLDLIVEGQSTREIAEALGLKTRTVDLHRHSVMHKMGARSSVDLVRMTAVCRPVKGGASSP